MRKNRIVLFTAAGVALLATTLKADFLSEYADAYKVFEEAEYSMKEKKFDSATLTFIEAKSKFSALCRRYPKKDLAKAKKYIKSCDALIEKIKAEIKKLEEEKKKADAQTVSENAKTVGNQEVSFLKESLLKVMLENKELNAKLKKSQSELKKALHAPKKNNGVKFAELMRTNGELESRNAALAEQIVKLKEVIKKRENKSDFKKLIDKQAEVNRLNDELQTLQEQNSLLKDATQKNSINKNSLEFELTKLKRMMTKKDNELALLKKRLDKGSGSITKLEDLETLAEENFKLKAKVNNLKNQVTAQAKVIEKNKNSIKSSQNEAVLMNENKKLKQKIAELARDFKKVIIEKSDFKTTAEFEHKKVKALEKRLKEATQKLTAELEKKKPVSNTVLEQAKKDVEYNKKVYAKLYKDNEALKKQLAEYAKLKNKISALTAEKISVSKKLLESSQANNNLKSDLKKLQLEAGKVKNLEDAIKKIKALSDSKSKNYSRAIEMIKKLKEENEVLNQQLKKSKEANKALIVTKKSEVASVKDESKNETKKSDSAKGENVTGNKNILIINKGLQRAVKNGNKEAIFWHCAELLKLKNDVENKYLVVDTINNNKLENQIPNNLVALLKHSSNGVVYEDINEFLKNYQKK